MSHIGGYGLAYYQRCFAQRSISAKLTLLFLNIFVAIADGVFLYKKSTAYKHTLAAVVWDIYLAMPK